MRVFIAVLVLILNLQSWTKADDISDFEIEGMSIGDSLLDHYNVSEIYNFESAFYSNSTKYKMIAITDKKFKTYQYIQVEFLTDDKDYIIQSLSGNIEMNISSCLETKKELVNAVINQLPNTKMKEFKKEKHSNEYPNSFVYETAFILYNGDRIRVYCIDWSDKATSREKYNDHLSLDISTKEFLDWLNLIVFK